MTRRMSAKEARDNFSDVLGLVYYGNEPVIVEKKGRPFAVVISPKEYAHLQQVAKEQLFSLIDHIQERISVAAPDDVLQTVTEAVEGVRQSFDAGSRSAT